ncbi:uncharacterized protein [Ptychodera flava]|uniref:uncharacterized protein n=1 Tax=Ptychodera flava TaxID=63121 RepID=UPI003969C552
MASRTQTSGSSSPTDFDLGGSVDDVKEIEEHSIEEESFCICKGEETEFMVACDNEKCAIEWWHYACAGLTPKTVPDGDWICPKCKGEELVHENQFHQQMIKVERKKPSAG